MSLSKRMKNWPLTVFIDGGIRCEVPRCGSPHFLKEFHTTGSVKFMTLKFALIAHIRKYHS